MPNNLEGESIRRCKEHTEALVEDFELGVLWDEYGIVGDIVVRCHCRSLYYVSVSRTYITVLFISYAITPTMLGVDQRSLLLFCCSQLVAH